MRPARIGRSRVRISRSVCASTDDSESSRIRIFGSAAERPRQRHPLPLAARERQAALAHQRVVAVGEGRQIGRQPGRLRRPLARARDRSCRRCAPPRRTRCSRRPWPKTGRRPAARSRSGRAAWRAGSASGRGRQSRTAPGATSCMRTSASTRVVFPAPVGPTIASVAPAGSETTRRRAARRPSTSTDRSRASIDGDTIVTAAPRGRRRIVDSRRRLQQLAHAHPAGDPPLPDPDDPAERDGRPGQQHQVGVERHQPADRHPPQDHLAAARPQHDQASRRPPSTAKSGDSVPRARTSASERVRYSSLSARNFAPRVGSSV